MMIQKSKDKPLQFDANLEKKMIRTFEMRSKNTSCERAVLYVTLLIRIFYIAILSQKINNSSPPLKFPLSSSIGSLKSIILIFYTN